MSLPWDRGHSAGKSRSLYSPPQLSCLPPKTPAQQHGATQALEGSASQPVNSREPRLQTSPALHQHPLPKCHARTQGLLVNRASPTPGLPQDATLPCYLSWLETLDTPPPPTHQHQDRPGGGGPNMPECQISLGSWWTKLLPRATGQTGLQGQGPQPSPSRPQVS